MNFFKNNDRLRDNSPGLACVTRNRGWFGAVCGCSKHLSAFNKDVRCGPYSREGRMFEKALVKKSWWLPLCLLRFGFRGRKRWVKFRDMSLSVSLFWEGGLWGAPTKAMACDPFWEQACPTCYSSCVFLKAWKEGHSTFRKLNLLFQLSPCVRKGSSCPRDLMIRFSALRAVAR